MSAAGPRSAGVPPAPPWHGDGAKPAVLVAEDLSIVRRPICLILERQGFRVIEVQDGAAAIEALGRERVDAVVVDLAMPIADGFAVLDELRKRPDPPAAIVMTAHLRRADVERALALGAGEVLVKGAQPIATLVEKVRAAVARRREDRTVARRGGEEEP